MTFSIFLVEDDPALRDSLILVLGALDSTVVVATAQTEEEASTWLRQHEGEWDLTVMDLLLESGTGFGVLASMPSQDDRARVVVLTNSATPSNRSLCRQLGVGAVFDKTHEISEFLDYCGHLPPPGRTAGEPHPARARSEVRHRGRGVVAGEPAALRRLGTPPLPAREEQGCGRQPEQREQDPYAERVDQSNRQENGEEKKECSEHGISLPCRAPPAS